MTERVWNQPNPGERQFSKEQLKRWRAEFPYHWDADELVSRRELLQFAVYTSGALFASTFLLAILNLLRRPPQIEPTPIARVNEVPEGEAVYFNFPEADEQAVLLHLPGGRFVAYSAKCTHLSCAVYYQGERNRLYCPCHEGIFDPMTGEPVAGPPERRLPQIVLERQADQILAVGIRP